MPLTVRSLLISNLTYVYVNVHARLLGRKRDTNEGKKWALTSSIL